ncbi:MAG: serine/threonine protein kinase [Chloroflexi bacterium]|nr:serine/threonine protein kinase [Chloroflexota bacterium]
MMPLVAGHVLRKRYKILRPIGQGGMGSIYQAEDLRLDGRLCAIKEVQHDPSFSPEAQEQSRDQFRREATTLARLDHPNLPKVSDFFSEGARDFLVMDYVPGSDLKTLMDEARRAGRTLPEDDVLGWAAQIADALIYLHSQEPPVLHRDIKPANIRATPSGLIKLVDFGLVKLLAPDERTITVVQGRGTALYTPLEQYGGDTGHTDARSDVYSFGATLYHLLTNEPPAEAKQRFLSPDSLRPPRVINPAISPQTERAVLWAMAMHPDERPASMAMARDALFTRARTSAGKGLMALNGGRSRQLPAPAIPWYLLNDPVDKTLATVAGVLLFIAFMVTVFGK